MIKPVPAVGAMASYALADLQPELISLVQNESAYEPSPLAVDAGRDVLSQTNLYPDPDWVELRTAIARVHGLPEKTILCGAGSMELIAATIRSFSRVGDEVLGTEYGYLFVATACQQAGSDYVQAPEPDLCVSVDSIIDSLTSRTRIVFVCNPGNPTGTSIDNAELVRLRGLLPEDVLLIIDQAYAEFDSQDHRCVFELLNQGNTVITRTFSKAYALAGQRVGWGAFPENVALQVRKLITPNNVSMVAQAMATAAMMDQAYMVDIIARTAELREKFIDKLTSAGFNIPPSHTNFVLVPFASRGEAEKADKRLRSAGFLARQMAGYGLAHCLRITIEHKAAMETVADVIITS